MKHTRCPLKRNLDRISRVGWSSTRLPKSVWTNYPKANVGLLFLKMCKSFPELMGWSFWKSHHYTIIHFWNAKMFKLFNHLSYFFSSSMALWSPIVLFANSCKVLMNARTRRMCSPECMLCCTNEKAILVKLQIHKTLNFHANFF